MDEEFELLTPDARTDPTWLATETTAARILEDLLEDSHKQVAHWKAECQRVESLRCATQKELRMYEKFFELLYLLKEAF